MSNIIYKLIKTPEHRYVYDRATNSLLRITDDEYDTLHQLEHNGQADLSRLDRLTNAGFLTKNQVGKIEHPCSSMIRHLVGHHIEQLTLQVTQRCNLRCKYCVYGGEYNNRGHSHLDMSFDMAKQAIDYYLNSSEETEVRTFGFYGGEPLLCLDLIKECVKYIEDHSKGKELHYSLTTNATLLLPDTVDYLCEKGFNVLISLDGSRGEHNEYRVFPDGSGSFDIIMNNLRDAKSRHPDMTITFNTVYNPKHNYENVKRYFEEGEIIADASVLIQLVEPNSKNTNINFADEFYLIRKYDYFKLLLHLIGKLKIEYLSKLVLPTKAQIIKRFNDITGLQQLGTSAHHSGPCVAGVRRLFANVHGNLYPCERVPETSEIMKIGTVKNGIDADKAYNLTNVGCITEAQCKECWALMHCGLCCQKADGGDSLSAKIKLSHCSESRDNAYQDLVELCVLHELGCSFEED